MTRIFDADGETTVAVPFDPDYLRRHTPEAVVRAAMPAIVRSCREIGARPIAGQSPTVLSEREMRQVDPGAVLWAPGKVWVAIPVRRDRGEDVTTYVDPSPD